MDPKDIKEIKAIIDLMKKHDLSVFEMEKDGFRLKLQKGPSVAEATTRPRSSMTSARVPPVPTSIPRKDIVALLVAERLFINRVR